MDKKEPDIRAIAQSWCIKNKILVYAVPINNTTLRIVINYKNKPPIIGEKIYNSKGGKAKEDQWWEVVKELYVAYYKKEND